MFNFILRYWAYNMKLAGSVLSPLLTKDTIDFLNYTVSADERQLWMSLGDSWMKTR